MKNTQQTECNCHCHLLLYREGDECVPNHPHGCSHCQEQDWEKKLELIFCRPWGTKELKDFIRQEKQKDRERYIKRLEELNDKNLEYMEPCEPECTPVRHAHHEGSWQHHWKMEKAIDQAIAAIREDK